MQAVDDIKIGLNLRKLKSASDQFTLEYSGKTAKFADLVGPGKLVDKIEIVAGEKYSNEFNYDTDPVATLPDGIRMIYPATIKIAREGPKPKVDARLQEIQTGDNIRLLTDAVGKYLRQHPGKTAHYGDLVGPGKTIPKLTPSGGEKYPREYPPGAEITAIVLDGTILSYGMKIYANDPATGSSSTT